MAVSTLHSTASLGSLGTWDTSETVFGTMEEKLSPRFLLCILYGMCTCTIVSAVLKILECSWTHRDSYTQE